MFDSLKNLGKAVVNTAVLPVDAVLDAATCGDGRRSYLGKRFEKICENVEDIGD